MKGIVVEIENKRAAILGDDGRITKIRNRNYEVGESIHFQAKRSSNRKLGTLAACFVAVLMVGGMSTWAYATPYSSVSLDANPSIVLDVNRFDKVISYQVDGDDEVFLLADLKNMNIHDAVAAVIKEFEDNNAMDEYNIEDMVITVSSKNTEKTQKLMASLEKEASELAEAEGLQDINIEAEGIGFEIVQRARDYTEDNENETVLTPGKLNLISKIDPGTELKDMDDEYIDNYAGKSVKEIMQEVKEQRKSDAIITTPAGLEKKTTDAAIQKKNNGQQGEESED